VKPIEFLTISLLLIPSAFAQISSVPCIPPPAPPPANNPGQGRGPVTRQPPPQQSAAGVAEIARLMDLPTWGQHLTDGDYSNGPAYPTAPELAKRAGVPEGKVIEFVMSSSESKFYPGVNAAFQRHVCVYVPAGYVAGAEVPVIVSADAYGMRYNLPAILDNMIYDQRVPAMAAVMIDNGGAERSLEYDTVSSKYVEFVETEVLPRAEKEANVKLSKNPDARMTLGGSSGGAVALTMAWFRPNLYHRVLTYSGTFVNLRNSPEAPLGAYEYIEHLFPASEKRPYRMWIQVSENDNGSKTPAEGRRNWVTANSRLAKILKDKGYAYQFVYSKGAGHTQRKVIDNTLPQALEYIWLDYKPQR
jgi:enterochelin esterase family protein